MVKRKYNISINVRWNKSLNEKAKPQWKPRSQAVNGFPGSYSPVWPEKILELVLCHFISKQARIKTQATVPLLLFFRDTSEVSIFQEGLYMEDSAGEIWMWDKGIKMTFIILCMEKKKNPDFLKRVHSLWEPFRLGRQEREKRRIRYNLYVEAQFSILMKSLWFV